MSIVERAAPVKRRRVAIVGAGRAAAHLAVALAAIRQPVVAFGARDAGRAQALGDLIGLPVLPPDLAVAQADWVFMAVRDDAIETATRGLPWREGQLALHLSGATPLSALKPAQMLGAAVAGFHPLQLMADPLPSRDAALQAFQGIAVGIEAEGEHASDLTRLAQQLGAHPFRLPAAQRALYHAAANAGASGLLAPLALATESLQAALSISPEQAWAALQPLVMGTLRAVGERGMSGSLSGPVARGDAQVLAAHLQALQANPTQAQLYRALMRALLPMAQANGRLDEAVIARLKRLLA